MYFNAFLLINNYATKIKESFAILLENCHGVILIILKVKYAILKMEWAVSIMHQDGILHLIK
jgi:hypothetical protein